MKAQIQQMLGEIEQQNNVTILYACESGSRAWGFASPDSDYDVRFIYMRPAADYLSIRERRDVIELPVDETLDISGWDLRKALQLFLKSNPPLFEWLQSPQVYKGNSSLEAGLNERMKTYFSGRAGCHHYLSMAKNTIEGDLQETPVKLKKYFYALRPLLATQWIIENGGVPPMEFGKLRTLVTDSEWQATVDELLALKIRSDEQTVISPIPLLHEWMNVMLPYCKEKADRLPVSKKDTTDLDAFFRKCIGYDL